MKHETNGSSGYGPRDGDEDVIQPHAAAIVTESRQKSDEQEHSCDYFNCYSICWHPFPSVVRSRRQETWKWWRH